MLRKLGTILLLLLTIMLAGCGGSNSGPNAAMPGGASDGLGEDSGLSGVVVEEKLGFSLKILDASFDYGGHAEFSLSVTPAGGGTDVVVSAVADQMRAAYFELAYDDTSMYPVESEGLIWPGEAELLRLAVLDAPDAVHYGAIVPRPQEHAGVSGELELLRVHFATGVADLRSVSAFPTSVNSQVTDLEIAGLDEPTGDVFFSYFNQGDHDQNSQVNIADLTPLGANFNTGDGTPFPLESALSMVDGDANGQINIADITPIGANFNNTVTGFKLYGGDAADYPDPPLEPNGPGAVLIDDIDFSESTIEPNARRRFEVQIPGVVTAGSAHFWVRPHHDDAEGITSLADPPIPTGLDTTPPEWVFEPEGTGVVQVIPKDGAVKVFAGEAIDLQSSPVTYIVYYAEGTTVDVETALTVEFSDPGPGDPEADAANELTVLIDGLNNDTTYSFLVRARDSAAVPNEDSNTVVLTTEPKASIDVVDPIGVDTTFSSTVDIPTGVTVDVADGVLNLTFLSDLVIEEGATLNLSGTTTLTVEGDLTVNGSIIHDAGTDPVPDVEETDICTLLLYGNADFGSTSVVASSGNMYIVDDPADAGDPAGDVDDTDNGDPGEFPFNFDPVPEEQQASSLKFGSANKQTSKSRYWSPDNFWHIWRVRGDWGQVPQFPPDTKRIILKIRARNGKLQFESWTITGPHGEPGVDQTQCETATGTNGKDNPWRMRIHAAHLRWLGNNVITFGNGGKGGDAHALNCCPGATATGGDGGKPNNKFRFTGSQSFAVPDSVPAGQNTLAINPGAGGEGGYAEATGGDGDDGCPPENGCFADAFGGNGGDAGKFGMRYTGAPVGLANISAGVLRGGLGGAADATGGDGGNDTCCGVAGMGGAAFASAGEGGNAETSGVTPPMGGGAAQGGDGGDAFALGGTGGDGSSCFKQKGGDGGAGGDATALAGVGGIGTPSPPATNGENGAADAFGGDGGNGGDGFPPGAGGAGGAADAQFGVPNNAFPGDDGLPGEENPAGGIVIWCCDPGDLAPPQGGDPGDPIPIPNGHTGLADLENMSNGLTDGRIPFLWTIPPGAQAIYFPQTDHIEINAQVVPGNGPNTLLEMFSSDIQLEPGVSSKGFIGLQVQFGFCASEQAGVPPGFVCMFEGLSSFATDVPENLGTGKQIIEASVEGIPFLTAPTFQTVVRPVSVCTFDEIWIIDP